MEFRGPEFKVFYFIGFALILACLEQAVIDPLWSHRFLSQGREYPWWLNEPSPLDQLCHWSALKLVRFPYVD